MTRGDAGARADGVGLMQTPLFFRPEPLLRPLVQHGVQKEGDSQAAADQQES